MLRGVRALLSIPLFLKLVLANTTILVLAIFTSRSAMAATDSASALLLVLAVVGCIVVNAVIVRIALLPLAGLQEAAQRVANGDLDARAPASPVADRELQRLAETFNAVFDTVASNRTRLRAVAQRSETAAEEERKRIARELHDGTAQELAALRLRLRLARVANDANVQERQLDGISEDLARLIDDVRNFALGLRPPALDMLGLGVAAESLARSVARAAGIEVDVQTGLEQRRLRPDVELALYRILQEALGNVLQHSGATHVQVRLARTNGHIELSVQDDGRGFAPSASARPDSLGLFGMQERAAYVGGAVEIESEPGRGTRVTVAIPEAEAA
jgi:two-component system sensor histidine kinase UhpB